MRHKFTFKNPALEEDKSGKLAESEIVIYAKIGDIRGLEQADEIIQQDQLEARFENGIPCRIRKSTVKGQEPTYTFTFKVPTVGQQDGQNTLIKEVMEYNTEVDAGFYEGFRLNANRFITKTRYVFNSKNVTFKAKNDDEVVTLNVENVKYEVDVYQDAEGNTVEWCKIDVEIDHIFAMLNSMYKDVDKFNLTISVSHLPFAPQEFFLQGSENKQELIDQIWLKYVIPLEPLNNYPAE